MDTLDNKWQPIFNDKCNLIVCFDDIHPEYEDGHDFGSLKENTKLIQIINVAIEFSWVKFIIFVVPNWRYKGNSSPWPNKKFLIAHYHTWCNSLKDLMPNNMAIGLHGFTHFNSNYFDKWKEFYGLNSDETRYKIDSMLNLFEKSKLPYRKIFRPPGWEYQEDHLEILTEFNINHFAGTYDIKTPISKISISNQFGINNTSLVYLSKSKKIVSIPANYDIGWSSDFRLLDLLSIKGYISMSGHISNSCYETYIGNGPELNNLSRLKQNLKVLYEYYKANMLVSNFPDI
jgi:hypothetical protein